MTAFRDYVRMVIICALRTFAQGMLGAIGAEAATMGVAQVDWLGAASIGASAAIVSILMCVAGGTPDGQKLGDALSSKGSEVSYVPKHAKEGEKSK